MSFPQKQTHSGWWPLRKGRWQRLVEGADYGTTWTALLEAAAARPAGELLVVTAGTDPNGGGKAATRPARASAASGEGRAS
jgi:hypothetical protein